MVKGVGWAVFHTNGITGTKVMVAVAVGAEKVCQVWGTGAKHESRRVARDKVQDWIWGRPAKEPHECQSLRSTKIKKITMPINSDTCGSLHNF